MKILHFEAEKLHGYLSFELDFESDLVFLTGINGSGKTSAIRCIRALLAPSLVALGELNYARVSARVSEGGEVLTITSWRQNDDLCLFVSVISDSLKVPSLHPESFEPTIRHSKRQRNYYRDQEIKHADNATLSAILRLPTPMYLDIERRYQEGASVRRSLSGLEGQAAPGATAGSTQEGIKAAQILAEDAFRDYLDMRSKKTDVLKQDIVLAAFRPGKASSFGGMTIPSPPERAEMLRRITENEAALPSALSQIGISDNKIKEVVLGFFGNAREAVEHVPVIDEFPKRGGEISDSRFRALQNWAAIEPQVRQIDKLAELIEAYNKEIAELFSPIGAYLGTVNGFLSEVGKTLKLSSAGKLLVSIRDDGSSRPIYELSSGEKQMVVILTHLAFNKQAKLANVLIIDEPELSLHIRWQELFVDAVMSASPGLQVILATHSPSIIRGRIDKCIDVLEARHSDSLFG
jgi:energy-coupling factor transporter ATP-binding protein EcfA2